MQGNKYEGYVVWINALIAGRGRLHRDRHRDGRRRVRRPRLARQATQAAGVIREAGRIRRAPPTPPCPTRARCEARWGETPAAFMVNWTVVYLALRSGDRAVLKTTSAGPATRRPWKARSPSPRPAASTSG